MWEFWTSEGLRTFPRTILGKWKALTWEPLAAEMYERDKMLAIVLRLKREPKIYRWFVGGQEGKVSSAKEAALAADRVLRDAGFVLLNKAWPTDAEFFNAPDEECSANDILKASNLGF